MGILDLRLDDKLARTGVQHLLGNWQKPPQVTCTSVYENCGPSHESFGNRELREIQTNNRAISVLESYDLLSCLSIHGQRCLLSYCAQK